jgi:hypothetical protein
MDRATKAAIVICVVGVFLMLMLAAYGYFGGAWDSAPT